MTDATDDGEPDRARASADALRAHYADDANLQRRRALYEKSVVEGVPADWQFGDLLSILPPRPVVLEVGSGPGTLWERNSHRIPDGAELVITDFSAGMVEIARERCTRADVSATFAVVDVQALPYRDSSFDVVVAGHMLYHVPDLDRAVGEIARVLRPAGMLVATTNGSEVMKELMALEHRVLGTNPSPLSTFTLENGPDLLKPAFAHVERRRHVGRARVTDASLVIEYLRSLPRCAALLEDDRAVSAMRVALNAEVASHGFFALTVDVGTLVAREPRTRRGGMSLGRRRDL